MSRVVRIDMPSRRACSMERSEQMWFDLRNDATTINYVITGCCILRVRDHRLPEHMWLRGSEVSTWNTLGLTEREIAITNSWRFPRSYFHRLNFQRGRTAFHEIYPYVIGRMSVLLSKIHSNVVYLNKICGSHAILMPFVIPGITYMLLLHIWWTHKIHSSGLNISLKLSPFCSGTQHSVVAGLWRFYFINHFQYPGSSLWAILFTSNQIFSLSLISYCRRKELYVIT